MVKIDRSIEGLHPLMRAPFEAWLAHARRTVVHVDFRVTETSRTLERQRWLYAQGREEPYLHTPEVTWTLDSMHRWGLAVDIAMIRKETNQPIWEVSSWDWLYRTTKPERFGLRHLAPREWVHLEYRYARQAIAEASNLGLKQG